VKTSWRAALLKGCKSLPGGIAEVDRNQIGTHTRLI